jgi:hypothetical protein
LVLVELLDQMAPIVRSQLSTQLLAVDVVAIILGLEQLEALAVVEAKEIMEELEPLGRVVLVEMEELELANHILVAVAVDILLLEALMGLALAVEKGWR